MTDDDIKVGDLVNFIGTYSQVYMFKKWAEIHKLNNWLPRTVTEEEKSCVFRVMVKGMSFNKSTILYGIQSTYSGLEFIVQRNRIEPIIKTYNVGKDWPRVCKKIDNKYPHICRHCQSPSYNDLFGGIECSNNNCQNYKG